MSERFRAVLRRGGRSRPGAGAGSGELLQRHLSLAPDWLTRWLPSNLDWSPQPSISLVAANHSSPNPGSSPAPSYPTLFLLWKRWRGEGKPEVGCLGAWVSGSSWKPCLERGRWGQVGWTFGRPSRPFAGSRRSWKPF